MRKKIRLEHTSNPLNYGTNMMVTNFMYYLDKYSELKNEYILDVYNDEDLHNFNNQYKEGNIKRETIDYSLTYSNNIIEKAINKIKRKVAFNYFYTKKVKKLMKSTHNLVILGGDDLSEYYGIDNLIREFSRIEKLKNKIGIYLVGQTIGPFTNERIEIAKTTLRDVPIYSRDPWTTNYLKGDLKLNKVFDSADLAFLPLPYQDNMKIKMGILKRNNIDCEKYVTIVPSGLYESYCSDFNIYIENWIKIIENLPKRMPKIKIVLLPHVLRYPMYDDRNIIHEIEKRLQGKNNNLIYIYDEISPLEARFILGEGKFTITGRMHGAISTFQMRKPAISISYSVKYNGVIGEGLDLKELIVDGKDNEAWTKMDVEKQVSSKIDYVLENYESIIEKIEFKVNESEKKTMSMMQEISKTLG